MTVRIRKVYKAIQLQFGRCVQDAEAQLLMAVVTE